MEKTTSPSTSYWEWLILHVLIHAAFIGVFGLATTCFAIWWKRRDTPLLYQNIGLLIAGVWLSGMILWEVRWISLQFWFLSAPLTPLASQLWTALGTVSYFLKPKTQQEQLRFDLQRNQQLEKLLTGRANRRRSISPQQGWVNIGAKIKGDTFPSHSGVREHNGWLLVNDEILNQHLFVLGAIGAGKSETLKRLILEILTNSERQLYFVDGKGDEQLAQEIQSLAFTHGRGVAPIFKLGFAEQGAKYHAFQGSAIDIANRLSVLIGLPQAEGDARYYADINGLILRLMCKAGKRPPRSFQELLERCQREWLEEHYLHDPRRFQQISRLPRKHLTDLEYRLAVLAEDFEAIIDPSGFTLEGSKAAIFSIRTQSVSDSAQRLIDFLVEDFKDFVGKRQQHPCVFVIDEFGQFGNEGVTALLALARSAGLALILATQDIAALKDESTCRLILANTRTKLLMATDFPEEVGKLAGTMYQVEPSEQFEQGMGTGAGSSRTQHTFKIDMNEVAGLQPGEAYIIKQRYTAKIKVRAIGDVHPMPPQNNQLTVTSSSEVDNTRIERPPRLDIDEEIGE